MQICSSKFFVFWAAQKRQMSGSGWELQIFTIIDLDNTYIREFFRDFRKLKNADFKFLKKRVLVSSVATSTLSEDSVLPSFSDLTILKKSKITFKLLNKSGINHAYS